MHRLSIRSLFNRKVGPAGFEQCENPSGNPRVSDEGVTESVTIDAEKPTETIDPDLAAVMAAWPDLPPALRAGILAMVAAAATSPAAGSKIGGGR